MSNKPSLPIARIAKVADDIRTINGFAENHNFDASLLNVEVIPKDKKEEETPKAVPPVSIKFTMIAAYLLLAVAVGAHKMLPDWPKSYRELLFLGGLLAAVIATMAVHLKFKENTVTIISVIGCFLFLFIGTGVFTPQEAFESVKDLKE